jgi:hypothetical protein
MSRAYTSVTPAAWATHLRMVELTSDDAEKLPDNIAK